MANGEIELLKEMRELVETPGKLPTATALRQVLTSQISLVEVVFGMQNERKVDHDKLTTTIAASLQEMRADFKRELDAMHAEHSKEMTTMKEEFREGIEKEFECMQEGQKRGLESIQAAVDEVKDMQAVATADRQKLMANYMVRLGGFIKEHPRITAAASLMLLFAATLWLQPHFRHGVLEWLKVPDSFIEWLEATPIP